MSWFVIRTKPRQERKAKQHLENQEFNVYLPELMRDNGAIEVLFPGYIFIRNQAGPTPFDKVRFTRGVLNYVRFGNKIALARDELIQTLHSKEQEIQGAATFEPNQKVRIKNGPFKDVEAIYLTRNGKDRVVLLLNILNTQQQIEMDDRNIDSA